MADTLKLEIVTPGATTYSEDVSMVTLPAVEGQIGIYPHHVPLMTRIVPGELRVRKEGQDVWEQIRTDQDGGTGQGALARGIVASIADYILSVQTK